MPQDWASSYEAGQHRGLNPEDYQTIPILRDHIAGIETPAATASRIAAHYKARLASGNNKPPYGLWGLVCEIIEVHGDDKRVRDLVIQLLLSLAQIEVRGDADGKPVAVPELRNNTFWRELPGFSLIFRDKLTNVPPTQMLQESDWDTWRRRFTNANVFQATWLAEVGDAGPERELGSARTYALWHLSCTLDPGVAAGSPLGARRTDMWVPQAALWILIAGPQLWALCRANHDNEGAPARRRSQEDAGVDGFLWEGTEGMSVERWRWWRRRFGDIAALDVVTPEVKDWAEKAAARMEEIEKAG